MRIYDSRLGRFLSVDPISKEYPWYSPYQFAGNKPIKFIDIDGMEEGESFWTKFIRNSVPAIVNMSWDGI